MAGSIHIRTIRSTYYLLSVYHSAASIARIMLCRCRPFAFPSDERQVEQRCWILQRSYTIATVNLMRLLGQLERWLVGIKWTSCTVRVNIHSAVHTPVNVRQDVAVWSNFF